MAPRCAAALPSLRTHPFAVTLHQVPTSVRHPVEGAPWPVMVWFFPGGFTNGTAQMKQYAPEFLCARGVVVVTVTYRLGALGGYAARASGRAGATVLQGPTHIT